MIVHHDESQFENVSKVIHRSVDIANEEFESVEITCNVLDEYDKKRVKAKIAAMNYYHRTLKLA